jgi:cysteine desulfurase
MLGIYVSSGSACTSGSIDASHVLKAIGLDDETAKSSIRISIGKYNTKEDIDYVVENLIDIIKRQRSV